MTPRRLPAALLAAGLALPAAPSPARQTPPPAPDAKADPKKAAPEEEKAAEFLRAGKLDDALNELRKAARANPQAPPARLRLAEMLLQAGQPQPARVQVETAAAEDPRNPGLFLANASMALRDGRLTDTVLSCQAALALSADPRWDADQRAKFAREARFGMAAAFEARRDWASAKEQMTAVLNGNPKDALARQKLAAATFWLGGPEQAFAELEAARRDDPAADLPELRMSQLWAAKDEGKAEEWLKKAVTAHPKDPKALRGYAGWLLDNGRADAAQLYVDAVAQLDPKGRDTLAVRGLAARYRKDFAAAESLFEGLVREYPNDAFAAWNLALVLAESADPDHRRRAVDLAEAEARKNPRGAEGYSVLGWCYYKAGRPDDAEKALSTAASGGQVRPDTAYFLARVLADRGKTEEAHRIVKDAVNARGPFPFRADAQALLDALAKKLPAK